jgi:hypothetical protein
MIGEVKMKIAQISPYLNPAISINAMNSKIFHEDMENIQEEELKIFCSRLIKDSRVEFTIKENKE